MKQKSYYGICVGGPMAGKMQKHMSPLFVLTIMPKIPASFPKAGYGSLSISPEINKFTYVWVCAQSYGGVSDEVGMWVEEGQTLVSTIKTLLTLYGGIDHE